MNYNLANPVELKAARNRVSYLARKGQRVRITKVVEGRSLAQNSYLHLLIAAYATQWGYTLDEAKTIYKRDVNRNIYAYEKNGSYFLKSSADLTKDEMTASIDNFLEHAKALGHPLPLATDKEWLLQIENEIERGSWYTKH
jgi:hypothetical protein